MRKLPKENREVRKGAWDAEEDEKLRTYVETHGSGHWRCVGKKAGEVAEFNLEDKLAGLQRDGKSCRLRWTNYLRPDIRHGHFTPQEEDLIINLHAAHGSRWSLIAAQMPGRTDNDVKNHWNTRLKKKLCDMGIDPVTHKPFAEVLRDLAGTMAQSSGSGSQIASEAARRYFRDSLVNRAVQDFRKNNNPALVSTHQAEELVSTQEMNLHRQSFSPSNSGYNSPSLGTSDSSEPDAVSSRSASPLEHPNQHRHQQNNAHEYQSQSNQAAAPGTVVESSGRGTRNKLYLTSTQVHSEAHLSSFQEPGSSSQNFYPSVARPSRSVQPTRTDFNRWSLSSRSALPPEQQLPMGQLSRFGSELNTQSQSQVVSDYMQESDVNETQAINCTSGDSEGDMNHQAGSLHFGAFGGPSLTSPTTSSGHPFMDMASTQHGDLSGYAGNCPIDSGNLISPHLPNFHNPQMAGAPTGMHLCDQSIEVPSPRMSLWDFQE